MTTRLLAGLAAAYRVLDRAAVPAGSTLGQAGLLVGALAVGATVLVERLLFPKPLAAVPASLGFGRPSGQALGAAVAIGAVMLMFPLFARATTRPVAARDGWPLLRRFGQAGRARRRVDGGMRGAALGGVHHPRKTPS